MQAATLTPLARGRRVPATDEQLVAAARLGDDRAFETLYHRYHRRIAAYVLGMVKDHGRAEDVTQEIFLNALRRMRATDREILFKPWIYEIAKNACIDQFRRARRTDEVSYDADGEEGGVAPLVSGRPGPDEAAESRRQLDDLCGAFGGLSDSHHQILVLRELEGRSYQEIAERMDMTRPAVESTLFRARKRLSEEYEELVSGERCRKVQAIIETAGEGSLGARDRRTMARHMSHCQPCRRVATMAGLEHLVPTRTGIRGKIAAVLPLPAFLRDRWLGVGSSPATPASETGGGLVAWAHAAAPMADNASGWAKAIAATVAVAIAGVGAGAVATRGDGGGGTPVPSRSADAAVTAGPAAATAAPERGANPATARAGHAQAASGQRRGGGAVASRRQGTTATATTGAGPSGSSAAAPAAAGTASADATSPSPSEAPDRAPARTAVPSVPAVRDTSATVPSSPDVTQTVSATTQSVAGAVSGTTQAVTGAVGGTTQAVTGAVDGTTQAVQGVAKETTQAVQGVVDETAPALSGVTAGATQTVQGVSAGAAQTVHGTAGATTQAVQDVVGQTTDGVQGIVSGLGKPSSPAG